MRTAGVPPPRALTLGPGPSRRDTPEDRRRALDRLQEQYPGQLVERIDDGAIRAVSGAKGLADRPDLQRLVELSRAKAYDELRVRALDRLTRAEDLRERAAIFGMVLDAGDIIRTADGHVLDPRSDIGELDWSMQSWMAARERKAIRERTLAARRRLSEQGVPMTHLGYGRTFDKKTRTWGIDEAQAAVYRRIFQEVLDGRSLPAIADGLNREGIPAPRGGLWKEGTLRVVGAENAIGIHTSYGHRIPCPAIVDEATQRAALAALHKNAMWSGPRTVVHEALLRSCALHLWRAHARHSGRQRQAADALLRLRLQAQGRGRGRVPALPPRRQG
jgi:site-specific DNA recombinase